VVAIAATNHGAPAAKGSVRKSDARVEISHAVVDSGAGNSRLLRGFEFDAEVLHIGDDRLRGISPVDVELHGIGEHQSIVGYIESRNEAVLGVRRRMHLPAQSRIDGEAVV